MKWFIDGDQVVVTHDDFIDLQESPAVFVPANCEIGETIRSMGLTWLPIGDLRSLKLQLDQATLDQVRADAALAGDR